MLYRSTDCRSRRGAPVMNLAHNASFHSMEKIAPSNAGIKHFRPWPGINPSSLEQSCAVIAV
jgi:hypothetical protein